MSVVQGSDPGGPPGPKPPAGFHTSPAVKTFEAEPSRVQISSILSEPGRFDAADLFKFLRFTCEQQGGGFLQLQ